MVGPAPERVTTDGHNSYPRAIRETLGSDVLHRTTRYLNNRLEQDHRGIKQGSYPMRGFGSVASASRFCRAFDARAPVLSGPYDDEATGFPCPPTRGVPPPNGRFEGHDAGSLTYRMAGEKCLTHFLDSFVLSSDISTTILQAWDCRREQRGGLISRKKEDRAIFSLKGTVTLSYIQGGSESGFISARCNLSVRSVRCSRS